MSGESFVAACQELNSVKQLRMLVRRLEEDGIEGVPRDCDKCAIARYLQRRTGMNVSVEISRLPLDDDKPIERFGAVAVLKEPGGVVTTIQLSNTVERFMDEFDEGKYKNLEVPT